MRYLILVLIFTAFAGQAQASAQYKGVMTINKTISDRIGAEDYYFDLRNYLGDYSVGNLLGVWDDGVFKNANPNATNLMIWQMAFAAFIVRIEQVCYGTPPFELNQQYSEFILPFCQWPQENLKTRERLQEFWLWHMGYDAPLEEFEAWANYFLSENYKLSSKEALSEMILSIFMNPHFLLRK